MLLLALPGNEEPARALAARIGCGWDVVHVHRFPDGEVLPRIDVPVSGQCVMLACSLDHPETKTLPLLFAADAARELGAAHVGLVAPYLGYMRQDKRFNPGEAVTSRSYARLLSGSFDFLVTVDPHLHRWRSLADLYPIPAIAVASAPEVARWIRMNVAEPLIVGPDSESAQWVSDVARRCRAPWVVLDKARHGDRDVRVTLPVAPWTRRVPVLLDDIASTGATLVAATRAVREATPAPPVCIVVHALFEHDAVRHLLEAGVERVVSCDSVRHPSNAIPLDRVLARAVREVASSLSLSRTSSR